MADVGPQDGPRPASLRTPPLAKGVDPQTEDLMTRAPGRAIDAPMRSGQRAARYAMHRPVHTCGWGVAGRGDAVGGAGATAP